MSQNWDSTMGFPNTAKAPVHKWDFMNRCTYHLDDTVSAGGTGQIELAIRVSQFAERGGRLPIISPHPSESYVKFQQYTPQGLVEKLTKGVPIRTCIWKF